MICEEKAMKIAIIGPGSMGLLYGGYLARENEVFMLGRDPKKMEEIAEHGVTIKEKDGSEECFKVHATSSASEIGVVDLAIIFVKAYQTREALEGAKEILGENTILMTLQNGLGHEAIMKQFVDSEHIVVGNTNQGSSRTSSCSINHSGLGDTFLGVINGTVSRLEALKDNFERCGFNTILSDEVRRVIWNKLMINASSSVLSGVLQVPQGYVVENSYAWEIEKKLLKEMCETATKDGYEFIYEEQVERLRTHLQSAPDGLTSIYHDLRLGNPTECQYINGAVVSCAKSLGVEVPTHEVVVNLVKAMEGSQKASKTL